MKREYVIRVIQLVARESFSDYKPLFAPIAQAVRDEEDALAAEALELLSGCAEKLGEARLLARLARLVRALSN